MTMKPIILGPWPAGINNRQPDVSLDRDQYGRIVALRNAVNVDIDISGTVKRRDGYTKLISTNDAHSAYACDLGMFYVDGSKLYRFDESGNKTVIYDRIIGKKVCYEFFDKTMYFSDGFYVKKYDGYTVSDIESNFNSSEYVSLPAGSILRHFVARMYSAKDNVLWFSEPYEFEKVDCSKGFLQFPDTISIVAAGTSGLWVVADKTYFLSGLDPEAFQQSVALPYGAVAGTDVVLPNNEGVMWYSKKGVVVAKNDGSIVNVQEKLVAASSAESGASVIMDHNGIRRGIFALENVEQPVLAASSFLQMEVVRRSGDE